VDCIAAGEKGIAVGRDGHCGGWDWASRVCFLLLLNDSTGRCRLPERAGDLRLSGGEILDEISFGKGFKSAPLVYIARSRTPRSLDTINEDVAYTSAAAVNEKQDLARCVDFMRRRNGRER